MEVVVREVWTPRSVTGAAAGWAGSAACGAVVAGGDGLAVGSVVAAGSVGSGVGTGSGVGLESGVGLGSGDGDGSVLGDGSGVGSGVGTVVVEGAAVGARVAGGSLGSVVADAAGPTQASASATPATPPAIRLLRFLTSDPHYSSHAFIKRPMRNARLSWVGRVQQSLGAATVESDSLAPWPQQAAASGALSPRTRRSIGP